MANFKQNRAIKYLIECKQELAKVTWPSRKETTRYTILVFGITLSVGVFFFILDWVFNQGLNALINL